MVGRLARFVFVNNVHPTTPHVSGMRLSYFATAMAARGHEIVLLTGVPPNSLSISPESKCLKATLAAHDWLTPLVVEVAPQRISSLDAVRRNAVPAVLRRSLTAWHFLRHGGVFSDWTTAAEAAGRTIATTFEPDLVWATFGNTSNLSLGQFIARHAACPWVLDIKDNWSAFVPAGLRQIMAKRFADAAGMTANAQHHLNAASPWLRPSRSCVVYSGVAEVFFHRPPIAPGDESAQKREVLLIGGTYSLPTLSRLLVAIRAWLVSLPADARARIRFVYAGSDSVRVEAALRQTQLPCEISVAGQLPLEVVAQRVQYAFVACYLWAPFGFHHKLLELLATGTPVVAFPGEHHESKQLAARYTSSFAVASNVGQLCQALQEAWDAREIRGHAATSTPPAWRWDDFAVDLDAFFLRLLAERPDACVE